MKDTNQLLTNVVNQAGSAETLPAIPAQSESKHADNDLMERIINDLFIFLKNSYSSFRATLKTDAEVAAAKREWSRTLIENGVTSQEQIFLGKQAVRKKGGEWAPGPSDFCKMCIPPDLNIPEMTQAYYEAANAASHPNSHPWSHGIVYCAAKQVGWYLLKTETSKVSQPAFNRVYKDMIQRMHLGEKFKSPDQVKTTENRLTVDAKNKTRTNTEQNKKAHAAFKNSINW